MRFKAAMDELVAAMGMPSVTSDDSGAFSLLFDDKFEISFSPDGEDDSVVFHADVSDASELAEGVCRSLLEQSLLGAKTGGASFSIDPTAKRVVIWKRYRDFADCGELERALEQFLGQVVFWMDRLSNGAFSAAETVEPPPMQAGAFMKV